MTILSNHRVHSYKAASVRHRDISPKKVPIQTTPLNKKKSVAATPTDMLVNILLKTTSITQRELPMPPPIKEMLTIGVWDESVTVHPKPSAPPAEMAFRMITVYGVIYHVDLPVGFDIYEGLRIWYPSLYDAVIEEEESQRIAYQLIQELSTDEEIEEMWNKYDYMEWLHD